MADCLTAWREWHSGKAPCFTARLLHSAVAVQEEVVEKACEHCGGANVAHTLRHAVQRLPRVLCLHLKRFKARRRLLLAAPSLRIKAPTPFPLAAVLCQDTPANAFTALSVVGPLIQLLIRIRLPRLGLVLVVWLQVAWDAERQTAACQKLHTGVEIPEAVDLGSFLAAAAQPPLPSGTGQHRDPGKENEQHAANPSQTSSGPEGGAAAASSVRPGSEMRLRSGVSFYGGDAAAATPIASHALLQPTPAGASPAALGRRRAGTPGAGGLLRGR